MYTGVYILPGNHKLCPSPDFRSIKLCPTCYENTETMKSRGLSCLWGCEKVIMDEYFYIFLHFVLSSFLIYSDLQSHFVLVSFLICSSFSIFFWYSINCPWILIFVQNNENSAPKAWETINSAPHPVSLKWKNIHPCLVQIYTGFESFERRAWVSQPSRSCSAWGRRATRSQRA